MDTQPLVGIFTYPSLTLGRDLIRGITRYSKAHTGWRLYLNMGLDAPGPRVVPTLDAALISVAHPHVGDFGVQLGVPVINLSGRMENSPFPRVCIDDCAAGRMGATHLLEKGFRSIALFASHTCDLLSRERIRGASEACAFFDAPEPGFFSCEGRHDYWMELRTWLQSLPMPSAILAENDFDASLLRQACWENGQDIPGDIAVLGLGNDDLLCEAGAPSLSSIQMPMVDIGYRAAEKLDLWLRGTPPEDFEERLPPLRVIERASTDIVCQDDPRLAKVLGLMKEHACKDHSIDWYARQAGINRRSLEIQFRKVIKRSPREEIVAQRIRHACMLLETTNCTVEEVAQRCGYRHTPNFTRVFRGQRGMTPGDWRKLHPPDSPAAIP
ncbi:MAG: substrate-binding domain-containing protein [Verrucomicrobia bacterium]|nr:substrate-binding domain-containing protein [Verrucomicrobiota bacterium]MCH8514620.1 substrate-binding domain-containing protein [Kiritimatiellia bacterium]